MNAKKRKKYTNKDWGWMAKDDAVGAKNVSIPNGLYFLWATNYQIKDRYNLATLSGRVGLTAWWLNNGVKDYPAHEITIIEDEKLFEPADIIGQGDAYPVSRIALATAELDGEFINSLNLYKLKDRIRLINWYYSLVVKRSRRITEKELKYLHADAPDIKQDSAVSITREMAIIWNSRKDLMKAFDLATYGGRQRYIQWWTEHEEETAYSISDSTKIDEVEIVINNDYSQRNDSCIAGSYLTGGLNLIGLAKGELGIGEDVRMAARAMLTAEINFTIFNYPEQSNSRQKDLSLASYIKDELVYNVNMVNLTGFEHASLFARYGKKIFDKRFTIGAWPWELPTWPRQWNLVYKLVDEIWASSRYAVDAYSNSPVPVVHMPMTVDFDSVPEYTRSDFKLPPDTYLFLYVFDSLSYMARKNPIAHLDAFWKAFPRSRKDVGLVVKTMNTNLDNETWKKFHEMVSSDDRIILITETLSRNKILGLMNNCDAFLSLHRSEGFGRCIAEMMWLGKPIIATNYSGNTDFTTDDTAFLVDGPLVVVGKGEYPYGENQYWCNPDVDQAANHMRTCFEGGEDVKKIAVEGKKLIRQNYSFDAVATRYTERLKHLGIL